MTALAERLPRTAAVVAESIAAGLTLGAQVYVSRSTGARDGEGSREVVADAAVGEIRPGEPLTTGARMLWLSASKPITAVALATFWERGLVGLDDRIAEHVPEFAQGGKAEITLRHALTHTGGFRTLGSGWPRHTWDEIITRVCAARLEPRWVPGETAGYHQAGSWFILGEILLRRDAQAGEGRSLDSLLRELIFEPCDMEATHLTLSPEERRGLLPRLCPSFDTSEGGRKDLGWDSEPHCARASPAGGIRGPMRDLGRFYEMMLDGGRGAGGRGARHLEEGARIITPQTAEALTARHRVGLYDKTFRHVMDWGLGFIPDSKLYGEEVPYAYGPHCSRRAFGHSGYRSTAGFADPEHGLAVAVAFNGLPGDQAHERRMRATLAALYEDLGLA